MKKAKIQIGVGESNKIFDSCKNYALATDDVYISIESYLAGDANKDTVIDAIATLRKEVKESKNIYDQIEDACKCIEDSIKED